MSPPLSSLHTAHLAHLVERMRQGDPLATDELIRRTGLRLEALARQMLRRYPGVRAQVQTADVVQESRLRLLAALRQVTPTSVQHFYGLAGQHIRFHLLELVQRFRRGPYRPLDEHPEPVAPGTSEVEVADLEHWSAFHQAVSELPEEQRQVIDLRFYQDLTWPEVAEALQIHERTARAALGPCLSDLAASPG